MTVFRFVDDAGNVRLDLNDPNGFVLGQGLDIGRPEIRREELGGTDDGEMYFGDFLANPLMIVPVTLRKQTDTETMEALIQALNTELNRETNRIEYQKTGADDPVILETFRSPLISMHRGESGLSPYAQLRDNSPVDLEIRRKPRARGEDAILLSAVAMTNEVGAFEAKFFNPGTMPSPAQLTVAVPASTAEAVQVRAHLKTFETEAQANAFATLYSHEAETGTLGTNTAASADVNASGDSFARTTYAAVGYMRQRVEVVITPATEDAKAALEGEYDVYAVTRYTQGSKQQLQLHSGLRSVDPLDNVHDPVVLDPQEANSEMWVPVKVGTVEYSINADELVLQLWSQLDVQPGAAVLDTDFFILAPIGTKVLTGGVMGWRSGRAAVERYLGDALGTPANPAGLTAGTVNENGVVLDAQGQAVGIEPDAGTPYPAGRLIVTARVTVKDQSGDKTELGVLRLRNVTDSTTEVSRKIYSKKNRKEWEHEIEVAFNVNGTDSYQGQVEFTEATPATGQKIIVEELSTRFIRVVADGDSFVVDADEPENDGIWSDGVKVAHLPVSTHLVLEPGWQTIILQLGEWSGLAYRAEVDEREPLAKLVQTRTFNTSLVVTPMHPA